MVAGVLLAFWVMGFFLLFLLLSFLVFSSKSYTRNRLRGMIVLRESPMKVLWSCFFGVIFGVRSVVFGYIAPSSGGRRLPPIWQHQTATVMGYPARGVASTLEGVFFLDPYVRAPIVVFSVMTGGHRWLWTSFAVGRTCAGSSDNVFMTLVAFVVFVLCYSFVSPVTVCLCIA
jgi:hypothetical protein